MTMKLTSCAAAVVASLALPAVMLPTGAFAQSQTQAQAEAPAGGSATARKAQSKPRSATERVEQHIDQLHAELRITPAQETEWDQFAEVMRDNAKDMDQLLQQRAAHFASMNAVENMQSYAQIAQQHAQDTQKLSTAFQTLYSDLSESQKKNADSVFREHGEHPSHGKG